MKKKQLESLIVQLENYIECWKQFYQYLGIARTRKNPQDQKSFTQEEENQFLDIKSVLAQQLELLLAYFAPDSLPLQREEILNIIAQTPSLRTVAEMNDNTFRGLENQWHKTFITMQSLLGQLKVKKKEMESTSLFGSLFSKK